VSFCLSTKLQKSEHSDCKPHADSGSSGIVRIVRGDKTCIVRVFVVMSASSVTTSLNNLMVTLIQGDFPFLDEIISRKIILKKTCWIVLCISVSFYYLSVVSIIT